MPKESLETQVALTREDTRYLRKAFDEFKIEIKKSFATKTTVKLSIAEAFNNHREKDHKGFRNYKTLKTALIILAASGAGGAGGDTIREIFIKFFGG